MPWSHRIRKILEDNRALQGLPFWIAAVLSGLVAVSYADLFSRAEHFAAQIFAHNPYNLFWLSPLGFLLSWLLVQKFAPTARGSGIPQVMAVFEIPESSERNLVIRKLLGFKTGVVKVLSSLIVVASGAAVGREGPTLQLCTGIFHSVGKRFQSIYPNIKHDYFLITGAAAGIAAAFNTPLGGIVYALEEFATGHFKHFKTALISGVIIAGLVAQAVAGSYLYLGFPKIQALALGDLWLAIFVALCGGFWGALFGRILYKVSDWRSRLKSFSKLLAINLACGLLFAALACFFHQMTLGPGRLVLDEILFTHSVASDWKLVVARFIGPVLSYLSGGAGGIFAPSLSAGGVLGAWLGELLGRPTEVINLMSLLGMIAFLTGLTRAPFTSFVLVLEMTDRHSAVFPMMISALTANAIARLVDRRSFYELMKASFLELKVPEIVRKDRA